MGNYGPFATIISVAAALVAVFSVLLLKMIGPVGRWTAQIDSQPSFVVTAGIRALSIGMIATTFVVISKENYIVFLVGAVIYGLLTFFLIARFDKLRRVHVHNIPEIDANGQQKTTWWGKKVSISVIIGTENSMRADAKQALAEARVRRPGIGLKEFLAGFGSTKVNDPQAVWSIETLADIGNKITLILMGIMISAVMALYWSASVVEIFQR